MATAGGPARRVILVSGASTRIQGGPATPIKLLTGNVAVSADPVLICVQMPAGTRTMGGPSLPCVQVASGGRAEGDVSALPVVLT